MDKLEQFLKILHEDIEYCEKNNAFMYVSTITNILNSDDRDFLIESTYWIESGGNIPKHYKSHVLREGEEFTGEYSSNGKVKFPYMRVGTYLGRAKSFVDYRPVSTEIGNGVFGWEIDRWADNNTLGWYGIKFRKSTIPEVAEKGLYEYVVYRPIFGEEKEFIKLGTNSDGSPSGYYTNKIKDRAIVSHGICDPDIPIDKRFPKTGNLPKSELEIEKIRVTESLLTEANRQQLLQKSRNAQNYSIKNQSKGKNRYDRRNKSSISATVRDYNMIQMDPLFKRDILEFKIPVIGETDVYVVDVRVDGLLAEVRKQVMANKGKLEFKVVLQSLMKVLNIGNVYIGCNCPDAIYRQAYWQTQDNYKAGYKERRPSNITNPNDTLGAGCKHVLLILANLDWAVKVASVINNYIKYCKENLQNNYAEYIFPKIYGVKYDKAVQLQLFDTGLFPDDVKTMNDVIDQGFRGKDRQGKFIKGNDMRFKKSDLQSEPSQEDENPLELDLTDETETEVTSEE